MLAQWCNIRIRYNVTAPSAGSLQQAQFLNCSQSCILTNGTIFTRVYCCWNGSQLAWNHLLDKWLWLHDPVLTCSKKDGWILLCYWYPVQNFLCHTSILNLCEAISIQPAIFHNPLSSTLAQGANPKKHFAMNITGHAHNVLRAILRH